MDSELESNVAVRGGRTVEWPYTKENTTDCKFNRMHIFMTPPLFGDIFSFLCSFAEKTGGGCT